MKQGSPSTASGASRCASREGRTLNCADAPTRDRHLRRVSGPSCEGCPDRKCRRLPSTSCKSPRAEPVAERPLSAKLDAGGLRIGADTMYFVLQSGTVSSMTDQNDALADINAIRSQIARGSEFRGYGPASVASSGVLALSVAAMQHQWLNRLDHDTRMSKESIMPARENSSEGLLDSGRVTHDARGNAVWEWSADIDSTNVHRYRVANGITETPP
jgi:hypothetical protein